MSLWLAVLLIWCALSVVLGLALGRIFPHDEDDLPSPPSGKAQKDGGQ